MDPHRARARLQACVHLARFLPLSQPFAVNAEREKLARYTQHECIRQAVEQPDSVVFLGDCLLDDKLDDFPLDPSLCPVNSAEN